MAEGNFSVEGSASGHAADSPIVSAREAARLIPSPGGEATTFDSGQASIHYAVFLPENYTPSYAYPLIVWFHDDGLDEQDVMHWLPRISPQNYLGIGLRAPIPVADGVPGEARWSTGAEHLHWLEEDLANALDDVCRRFTIHSERIVTAGIGRGGTMALQMLLRRPDWFAGAVGLNAALLSDWRLDWWGQYRGRRLWLGQSDLLGAPAGRSAHHSVRTLHAAGIDVTPRTYAPDEWPLDTLGRELDWWLMHALCGDTAVA